MKKNRDTLAIFPMVGAIWRLGAFLVLASPFSVLLSASCAARHSRHSQRTFATHILTSPLSITSINNTIRHTTFTPIPNSYQTQYQTRYQTQHKYNTSLDTKLITILNTKLTHQLQHKNIYTSQYPYQPQCIKTNKQTEDQEAEKLKPKTKNQEERIPPYPREKPNQWEYTEETRILSSYFSVLRSLLFESFSSSVYH